jgi:CRP-like cAMP-binding protein
MVLMPRVSLCLDVTNHGFINRMFNLESAIKKAIADSADGLARAIGEAVRQGLAEEFAGTTMAILAAGPRTGRGSAQGASKTIAAKGLRGARSNGISQSELSAVLSVVKSKPGLTSMQIQKQAGIDAKQASRVLKKLRKTRAVKVKGRRSVATYTLA